MKYLESSIKFLLKYWLLAIPLYVLIVIPALIVRTGTSIASITALWSSFNNTSALTDPTKIFSLLPAIFAAAVGGGILAIVLKFISYPATYGLANKGLETGGAGLGDIGQAISQNFVKYVLYFVGNIVVWLVFGIGAFIVFLILALLLGLLGGFGYFLLVLVIIAIMLAALVIGILLSLWLSAMVIDNLDVVAAAKKSIEIAKTAFWTILGITILVWIAGAIIGGILGAILGWIPFIGTLVTSVVPTATGFVMIVFYLSVYREKTGRMNSI